MMAEYCGIPLSEYPLKHRVTIHFSKMLATDSSLAVSDRLSKDIEGLNTFIADYIKAPKQPSGVKYDRNKPQPIKGLLSCFPRALEDVSKVSEYGANKYSWGGWKSVPNGLDRYKEAQLRHMLQVAKGEELDEESKMLHLTHSAWNALAVLELYLTQEENKIKETGSNEESSKNVRQKSPGDALRAPENTHNNKYSFWGVR